jgi:hypothetical protein
VNQAFIGVYMSNLSDLEKLCNRNLNDEDDRCEVARHVQVRKRFLYENPVYNNADCTLFGCFKANHSTFWADLAKVTGYALVPVGFVFPPAFVASGALIAGGSVAKYLEAKKQAQEAQLRYRSSHDGSFGSLDEVDEKVRTAHDRLTEMKWDIAFAALDFAMAAKAFRLLNPALKNMRAGRWARADQKALAAYERALAKRLQPDEVARRVADRAMQQSAERAVRSMMPRGRVSGSQVKRIVQELGGPEAAQQAIRELTEQGGREYAERFVREFAKNGRSVDDFHKAMRIEQDIARRLGTRWRAGNPGKKVRSIVSELGHENADRVVQQFERMLGKDAGEAAATDFFRRFGKLSRGERAALLGNLQRVKNADELRRLQRNGFCKL